MFKHLFYDSKKIKELKLIYSEDQEFKFKLNSAEYLYNSPSEKKIILDYTK